MDTLQTMDWMQLTTLTLPLLVLVGVALVVLLLDLLPRRASGGFVLIGIVAVAVLASRQWALAAAPVPIALLYFDRVSWIGALLVLGIAFCTLCVAPRYLRARELPRGEFSALLLFGVVGLWIMMATHHLALLFVGIETLSLAAYVLAAYHRREPRSIEAGIKYFLLGAVGAAFLLFGLAFLYGGAGTLDLLQIATLRDLTLVPDASQLYLKIGVACLLVGFAFKISAFPFQFWTPDVYTGAPLPVTAFFATAVKAGAFIALWRIALAVAPIVGATWQPLFWGAAVATMCIGNLMALTQEDMKRMLAYSSIAHAGYALIALVIMGSDATVVASLLFYLIAYSLMTLGTFAVLQALGRGDQEETTLGRVAGLASRRPGLAAVYALFLFSLAGFPPTIGFFAKYYLFTQAMAAGATWLVIIAVLNSVVSVAYYVQPIVVMYFRPQPEGALELSPLDRGLRVVLAITGLGVLGWGLFPASLLKLLLASAGN